MSRLNDYGQPIGHTLPDWTPCTFPQRVVVEGTTCRLEPIDLTRHVADLRAAFLEPVNPADWTYLMAEPPSNEAEFAEYLGAFARSADPLGFAVVNKANGRALGVACLMRIDPRNGTIEVGHIHLSRNLKRTVIATEAFFLLMKTAFDTLKYRRFEWKCDSFNEPSRSAALRLGFVFEGVFRDAVVYKGRSRDTAWFSIVQTEWPRIRDAFEHWLKPSNLDVSGRQRRRLEACTIR